MYFAGSSPDLNLSSIVVPEETENPFDSPLYQNQLADPEVYSKYLQQFEGNYFLVHLLVHFFCWNTFFFIHAIVTLIFSV